MNRALDRIVVVGGGIAGLTACDTLRDEGFEGELTIVGSEPCAAYSRPALSKALLRVDADLTAHELPPAGHGARELRGVSAVGLDVDRRRVDLDDGDAVPYDGLVIASGSRARRLSSLPGETTLRDLTDAQGLQRALIGRPDVLVLGGGVLGMEIASGALAAGCATTLVSTAEPMSRHLGAYVGALLTASALAQGLRVLRTTSATIEDHDGRCTVTTADGARHAADVVISAVGDVPNVEWLARSGLLDAGRLAPDARGVVGDGIVAAGDVAHWSGGARTALWTSAIEQAKVAARALLSAESAPLRFQNYFWTEQFGHAVKAVGDLPVTGDPEFVAGEPGTIPAVLRWTRPNGGRSVIAVDQRMPIPKLRRLADAA
ncbi:MAG: FAD-dependent oxidoreductase [Microbacterium sp.]|uniref:NAD(P)/FAD-dependent oxidoreductase n=1 Tax=Microbacterium sp. TaxID=51671 RepID=UPI00260E0FCD|nr:FAD-dependent oxidoreductase [Microbacterium sp.]MCX6501785.1 FAD-dependent oxidoreductase [Microbacterium sp.]